MTSKDGYLACTTTGGVVRERNVGYNVWSANQTELSSSGRWLFITIRGENNSRERK